MDIFRAVDGYGLARVDFFVKDDGEVVFNEINTMPGFTRHQHVSHAVGSQRISKGPAGGYAVGPWYGTIRIMEEE